MNTTAIITAALSIIGLIERAYAAYKSNAKAKAIIDQIVANAVRYVEESYVVPVKADPNVPTPNGRLTNSQQIKAKMRAADFVRSSIGDVWKQIDADDVMRMIDRAAQKLKEVKK